MQRRHTTSQLYYAKGTGVEQDAAKAVEWYKKAAAKGITASQVQLGKLLYSVDVEGVRDRNLATDLLRKAAETGDNDAKVALAALYLQAEDIARDPPQAKHLLKQAAEDGHAGAALQLGHLFSGKFPIDAATRLIPARQSNGIRKPLRPEKSKLNMPLVCYTSTETACLRIWLAAANWIEKAAHKDHASSQFQLGVMYCTGKGVPQDFSRAIAWYELAAQLGYPPAQYNLGVMLAKGQGCEPDHDKALPWLRKGRGARLGSSSHSATGI